MVKWILLNQALNIKRIMTRKINNSQQVRCIHLHCLIVLIILILFNRNANAQTLSLNEILNTIEQNNPALLSYQSKINADNELVNGAGALMPPKLSVEYDDVPYNLDYTMSRMRFSLMQDIPNSKKIEAKRNYLSSFAKIDQYEAAFYKIELFTQAKEAYYKRYIAEKRIQVLKESIVLMEVMISLAEKQMAIAKGELALIYRLKARLASNQTMLVHEQNMVRSETATLNYLMNADVNQTFVIDTNNLMKNYRLLNSYLKIDSLDYKRNDIMKMNSAISTMRLNQTLMSLNSKPNFSVQLTHFSRFGNRPDMFAVMGTMTLPFAPWSAKGYKSEVKSMDFTIQSMEQNKQNMLNMAQQMIKMYLIELESEYKELDNYTKLVLPAYKKSLDANLLSYSQNTNDFNMTLMSWDDLQMAQMEYLTHLETYFKIQAEYEKEMQIQ